ncbi:DUF3331 domain-containing protein [Paraburkholderia aromaticivorans]|uniref:DUF3331 domain-containing protein n=1 Tax=Paraburkholderia aromaticivorans TaxID=2026199 RepID=UPI0038B77B1B
MNNSDLRAVVCVEVATVQISRAPVWDYTIRALLTGCCVPANRDYAARLVQWNHARASSSHVLIEVVERLSDSTIAALWQDPTRCRYIDQVWISCQACSRGHCALTGTLIRRGDSIYKPRARGMIPANAEAMIVASVITARMVD